MSALAFVMPLLMIILSIVALVFWIKMLIDCVKRDFSNNTEKVVWIIVICLLQILGAIAYWFMVASKKAKA